MSDFGKGWKAAGSSEPDDTWKLMLDYELEINELRVQVTMLREALEGVMEVSGSSCAHYHIAKKALTQSLAETNVKSLQKDLEEAKEALRKIAKVERCDWYVETSDYTAIAVGEFAKQALEGLEE